MRVERCVILGMLAVSMSFTAAQCEDAGPVELTAEQDHRRMMELLGITQVRPGADGWRKDVPNAANYDESKVNQDLDLPAPLTLKNGEAVTSADAWWKRRRPEVVEDFDREVYGRAPESTPSVDWEVTTTTQETVGDVPVVTKKLVGHVDNSSYPRITVDIDLTLTTPAGAGPVYELLGKRGLGAGDFPPVETALVDGEVAFRQHSEGHTTGPNWPTFLEFADRYFGAPVGR